MPIPKPINTPSNSSENISYLQQTTSGTTVVNSTLSNTIIGPSSPSFELQPFRKVVTNGAEVENSSYYLVLSDGSRTYYDANNQPIATTPPNPQTAAAITEGAWKETPLTDPITPVLPGQEGVFRVVPRPSAEVINTGYSSPQSSSPHSDVVESTSLPVIDAQNIESRRVILRPFDFDHPSPDMQEYMQRPDNIMYPVYASGGMVMTYTPTISESSSMDYQSSDISQNNEGFNVYRGTKNRTITLSNVVFTCETPAQGLYALSVIHFLRSYSMTDFGIGRSGRPPSPMWFSAYGKYMYDKVPVLLGGYGFKSSDPELDLIPVPNPEQTSLYSNHKKTNVGRTGSHKAELQLIREAIQNIDYTHHTWLPIKVEIDSITLTVQHTPLYWKTFNLDDYRSGRMASSSTDWLW